MTLNDLESQSSGFCEFFAILGCGAHLEWIFAEITKDRPSQPAHEIILMLSRVSWALAEIYCIRVYKVGTGAMTVCELMNEIF